MQVKTCPATIKAAGSVDGIEEGVFEAIVAAYNVDSVGDRIMPGAFKASLDQWRTSGNPIPVLWSHKSDDPDYHIGVVEEAEEREGGLWVKARLDLDEPKSAKIYKLLKGRRVTQFSFAYDEEDARPAQKDGSGALKELHRLKVYEVGPCLIGANQATSLLDVKNQPVPADVPPVAEAAVKLSDAAAELKAGRVLSKDNEQLVEQIASLANQLLASVRSSDPAQQDPNYSNAEKATPTAPADESPAVKATDAVEPARTGTASARLPHLLDIQRMQLEAESETS